jgi:hypothetical protein
VAALAAGRPIPDPVAVPVEAGVLDRLIGTFRGSDVGTFAVTRDGDGLLAQIPGFEKLRLVPVGPLTFRTRLLTWTFVFDLEADGRAARVRIRDWKLNDAAERVTPGDRQPRRIIALDAGQLDALAGEYESLNGVLVRVERSGDHLTVTATAQSGVDIYPASPVEFFTKDATVQYTFVRDARGSVAGYLRAAGGGNPVPARRLGVGASP